MLRRELLFVQEGRDLLAGVNGAGTGVRDGQRDGLPTVLQQAVPLLDAIEQDRTRIFWS